MKAKCPSSTSFFKRQAASGDASGARWLARSPPFPTRLVSRKEFVLSTHVPHQMTDPASRRQCSFSLCARFSVCLVYVCTCERARLAWMAGEMEYSGAGQEKGNGRDLETVTGRQMATGISFSVWCTPANGAIYSRHL